VDRDKRLRELAERYEGYEVYDTAGEKIGKVNDLFVDETGISGRTGLQATGPPQIP
jgi:sporulation protein YlmC with PRC-barrel domain